MYLGEKIPWETLGDKDESDDSDASGSDAPAWAILQHKALSRLVQVLNKSTGSTKNELAIRERGILCIYVHMLNI